MPEIIRCPACFTFVYSDARRCHGCGEQVGRRRLLTRGSWIFIVLVVSAFTVARGIDLQQDQRDRLASELEASARHSLAQKFLHAWLLGDEKSLGECISDRGKLLPELENLRRRFPTVLPASSVKSMSLTEDAFQTHTRVGTEPIAHEGQARKGSTLLASTVPSSTTSLLRGRTTRRSWNTRACRFEAEVKKGDMSYTIRGQVCFGDSAVCCLGIHRVEGVEGPVSPTE